VWEKQSNSSQIAVEEQSKQLMCERRADGVGRAVEEQSESSRRAVEEQSKSAWDRADISAETDGRAIHSGVLQAQSLPTTTFSVARTFIFSSLSLLNSSPSSFVVFRQVATVGRRSFNHSVAS